MATRAHNAKYGSNLKNWQENIGWCWRKEYGSLKIDGPIALDFLFLSDKAHKDLTNMVKGAEDALQHVAFGDDDRVYSITARKEPASREEAGTRIRVSSIGGPAFKEHV